MQYTICAIVQFISAASLPKFSTNHLASRYLKVWNR